MNWEFVGHFSIGRRKDRYEIFLRMEGIRQAGGRILRKVRYTSGQHTDRKLLSSVVMLKIGLNADFADRIGWAVSDFIGQAARQTG
jgi:hypothetical protein